MLTRGQKERGALSSFVPCIVNGKLATQQLCSAREAHQKSLEYISTSIMAEGLTAPPPALLPAKFKGRPHAYVQYLNGGLFPYHDRGKIIMQPCAAGMSTASMQ